MALLCLLLLAVPLEAKSSKSKPITKAKAREMRDKRKMAAKRKKKELRRAERKVRVQERISEKKREKKKSGKKRTKPLTSKGLAAVKSKLSYMTKKAQSATDSIISLNGKEYVKYINNGPRSYYTMLVYTALGSEYKCSICHHVHKEMTKLSKAVNFSQFDPPIFLAYIDYEGASKVFQELQFRHIPEVVLVPPTNNTKKLPLLTMFNKIPGQYKLRSAGRTTVDDLANMIMSNSPATDINIPKPTPKVYKYVGLAAVSLIALYLLVTGLCFKNVFKYREYRTPYLLLVLVFYAWCAGAGMYNIIRTTQWYGGRGGSPEYFYRGMGSQYVYGSLIVGATNLGIGLSIILLNSWALTDASEKEASSLLRKLWRFAFRLVFNPWLVMALAVYIWWQLLGIYTSKKNGEYNYGAIRDHELFDSEKFYKDSVRWFKRTLVGKSAFRMYRKGSRMFWRFFRNNLEASLNANWAAAVSSFWAFYGSTKPKVMDKLADLQNAVDTYVLREKDEL